MGFVMIPKSIRTFNCVTDEWQGLKLNDRDGNLLQSIFVLSIDFRYMLMVKGMLAPWDENSKRHFAVFSYQTRNNGAEAFF